MNTLLVIDKDSQTDLAMDLKAKIRIALESKGHQIKLIELGRDEASPCLGCLLCLTRHPGECVNRDIVNEIKKNIQKYSLTIFVTPVLFGHFSSTIKNVMDRSGGSHNWQIIIGFGNDIDDDEKSTFIDLIAKHHGRADIIHPGMDKRVDVFVTRSTEDNSSICETLKN